MSMECFCSFLPFASDSILLPSPLPRSESQVFPACRILGTSWVKPLSSELAFYAAVTLGGGSSSRTQSSRAAVPTVGELNYPREENGERIRTISNTVLLHLEGSY